MTKSNVSFRAEDGTIEAIERYQEQNDFEDRSKAVLQLVEVGLREQKTPLLYNLGQNAIEAAQYSMIAALVVVVIGASPAGFGVAAGMWLGAALVTVGTGLLAGVELLKALNGQSAIGTLLRRGEGA
jgi:hypothetical protein